jgi:hypothetical protein
VIAWMWLDVAGAALQAADAQAPGRLAAAQYFFRYELPKNSAWLAVVNNCDMTCADMNPEDF